MDFEKRLFDIFEQKGIFLSSDEKNDELELDSIQFISIIVDIENVFNLSFPDNVFISNNLKTFNQFIEEIQHLLNAHEC